MTDVTSSDDDIDSEELNDEYVPDISHCSSDDDPGPPVYSPVSDSSLSESLSEDPVDEVLTTNLPSIPSVTNDQDDENCAMDSVLYCK